MWCSKISLGDVILIACYLINYMVSCVLNYKTPLNYLQESYPKSCMFSSLDLKTFGCLAFVHNHDPSRSKLDPKNTSVFTWIFNHSKRIWVLFLWEMKIFHISRCNIFFKTLTFFKKKFRGRIEVEIFWTKRIFWKEIWRELDHVRLT